MTTSLEELEKIITKLYGPHPDMNIAEYSNTQKEYYINNYQSFVELFEFIVKTNSQHCQFWLLDVLIGLVNTQYPNFSPEMKIKFQQILAYMIDTHINILCSVNFIANKF